MKEKQYIREKMHSSVKFMAAGVSQHILFKTCGQDYDGCDRYYSCKYFSYEKTWMNIVQKVEKKIEK